MSELFSEVSIIHRALDYHSSRHNLLASNIANADTPGFRPLELIRVPDDAVASNLPLTKTSETHLVKADRAIVDGGEVLEDATAPVGADGNATSLDREMAKLSANDLHQALLLDAAFVRGGHGAPQTGHTPLRGQRRNRSIRRKL